MCDYFGFNNLDLDLGLDEPELDSGSSFTDRLSPELFNMFPPTPDSMANDFQTPDSLDDFSNLTPFFFL